MLIAGILVGSIKLISWMTLNNMEDYRRVVEAK
jgi:hypothetical protein